MSTLRANVMRAAATGSEQTVKVWDPLVRVFHWSLVGAFAIAYFTEEELLNLHVWAGYVVIGLIAVRLIWGVIGTRHARFQDFVFSPAKVLAYLRDLWHQRATRYLGHNPAGGAMILLLLFSLVMVSFTGLAVYAIEEQAGPLVALLGGADELWEDVFEETHEFFANFTVLLIVLHVGGVLVESLVHRENLVRSMFTGRKPRRPGDIGADSFSGGGK